MSFLDRLKQAASFAVRTSPVGTAADLIRKAAPVVEDKLANVRAENTAVRSLNNAQRARTLMPGGLKQRAVEEILIKPAARVAASLGLETTNRITGKDLEITDSPLSRSAFSGPVSTGYAGEKGGQVLSASEQVKRIGKGEGDAGKVAKFIEGKTGIQSKYTAPLIGIGALALDANPVPDAKDATKVGTKLLDAATGLTKNIPFGQGKVLNQVDLLNVFKGKNAKKINDLSAVVRRADGKVTTLKPEQVTSWLQKNPGAEVVDTVGNIARQFGYKDAKEYVSEGSKLKFTQTDANMRTRSGLPQAVADTKQTKPVEALDMEKIVGGYDVGDPYKAISTIDFKHGDPIDVTGQALAIVKKLSEDGSEAAMQAKNALQQMLETSGGARKAAQVMRLMQEFYKQNPRGFMFEVDATLARLNKERKAAGKGAIEISKEVRDQAEVLIKQAAELPKGSLEGDHLFAEATKLIAQNLPVDTAKAIGSWFKSSILSGFGTLGVNLAGTLSPIPVEGAARLLSRTVGNAATNIVFGVRGASKLPNPLEAARAGYNAAKNYGYSKVTGAVDSEASLLFRKRAGEELAKIFGYDPLRALDAGTEAAMYFGKDIAKGTDTFTDHSKGIGAGTKTFYSKLDVSHPIASAQKFLANPIQSVKDAFSSEHKVRQAGLIVGDIVERTAKTTTGVSDIPAKHAYRTARLDEIVRAYEAKGIDMTDQRNVLQAFDQAEKETLDRFFMNDTWLSRLSGGMQRAVRAMGPEGDGRAARFGRDTANVIADYVIPFTTIPFNLAGSAIVKYSPINMFSALYNMSKLMDAKAAGDTIQMINQARDMQTKWTRGAMGSLAASSAFLAAYLNVATFGKSDKDKISDLNSSMQLPDFAFNFSATQRAWQAFSKALGEGKGQLEALKLARQGAWQEGDQLSSYAAVQPFALSWATMGASSKAYLENDDKGGHVIDDVLYDGGEAFAKTFFSQPMFTNLRQFGTVTNSPADTGAKWIGGVVAGHVPAFLRDVAAFTDRNEQGQGQLRETFTGNLTEGVWNQVKNRIPGLRQTLPLAIGADGNPVVNDSPGLALFGRDVAPRQIDTPLAAQVGQKLYEATGKTVAIPAILEKRGDRYNVEFNLSAEDLSKARLIYGKATEAKLKQLAGDPKFQALTADDQAEKLGREYSDIKARIDAYYVAKELGVTDSRVPWYKWEDIFSSINEKKDSLGRNLFYNLSTSKKREVINALLKKQ